MTWWRRGVLYQIYLRSFADSNGDGVGDLRGLTSRLDYLAWLGVDAVWVTPFYPSPMVDFGYDVTDHMGVDPLFGTLDDVDALVKHAHRRGLRVVIDYIANHTSDQHAWFAASRSSRDDPQRDWYLWADPAVDGGPPNNWRSVFGGPAWTLDEQTGQYYYHAYLADQPDLNWRNPHVRAAMLDVMHFWLRRGVDGFRLDGFRHLIKDRYLRDNPVNPSYRDGEPSFDALLPEHTTNQPEIHEIVSDMRRVLATVDRARDDEPALLAELYVPIDRLMRYYGECGDGVHLPSNMHLISTPYRADHIAKLIDRYEAALPAEGWPNWTFGNHDRSRVATRIGRAQARVAAMLLLTLRGTPMLYYGDEIGMRDVPVPPALVLDPVERNLPGLGLGRDPARTPMQWNAAANAGFCDPSVTPWLPVGIDHHLDVASQAEDPRSMLALVRSLLALRRERGALTEGAYRPLWVEGDALVYARGHADERVVVVLNLGAQRRSLDVAQVSATRSHRAGRIVISTHLDRAGEVVHDRLDVRPNEGVVIQPS